MERAEEDVSDLSEDLPAQSASLQDAICFVSITTSNSSDNAHNPPTSDEMVTTSRDERRLMRQRGAG